MLWIDSTGRSNDHGKQISTSTRSQNHVPTIIDDHQLSHHLRTTVQTFRNVYHRRFDYYRRMTDWTEVPVLLTKNDR